MKQGQRSRQISLMIWQLSRHLKAKWTEGEALKIFSKEKPWRYLARKSGPGREHSKMLGAFQEKPGQSGQHRVSNVEYRRGGDRALCNTIKTLDFIISQLGSHWSILGEKWFKYLKKKSLWLLCEKQTVGVQSLETGKSGISHYKSAGKK